MQRQITAEPSPAIRCSARLEGMTPYRPSSLDAPLELRLDANEGPMPDPRLMSLLASCSGEALRRYPRSADLEARLAERWGTSPDRLVVTNGGDDAIDRTCRALLDPGTMLVTHQPTFEMIPRSAQLAGAQVRSIPWLDGPAPIAQMIDAIDDRVRLVALVSPNNPTGGIASPGNVRALASACARAGVVLLLDLAYVEFADPEAWPDPTRDLLDLPNVVIVRTFSKAMGMAGLRVGYAIAPCEIARWLRIVGGPYPVSAISLALASASLELPQADREAYLTRVRRERERLEALLRELGARVPTSHANFVSAWVPDAERLRERLAQSAIGVRAMRVDLGAEPGIGTAGASPSLADLVRITLPGDEPAFSRLCSALSSCKEFIA